MSQWTHVNGSIRYDSVRQIGYGFQSAHDLKEFLGPEARYDDSEEIWQKSTIPCGSEGSLSYTVWEDPRESSLAAFTVNIFGDLRDYNNDEEIIRWLNKITYKKLIRSGICEINIEHGSYIIAVYDNELEKFKVIYESNS